MSLSDDIAQLEEDLAYYRALATERDDELNKMTDERDDLESQLADAEEFIEYVDKTHPELRTAFEATKKLEGQK